MNEPKTGAELIAAERQRQIDVEGWRPETDAKYVDGELVAAATCYARHALGLAFGIREGLTVTTLWPWDVSWWKPSDDPVRNLTKAGALIAAEIDRLRLAALPSEVGLWLVRDIKGELTKAETYSDASGCLCVKGMDIGCMTVETATRLGYYEWHNEKDL